MHSNVTRQIPSHKSHGQAFAKDNLCLQNILEMSRIKSSQCFIINDPIVNDKFYILHPWLQQ